MPSGGSSGPGGTSGFMPAAGSGGTGTVVGMCSDCGVHFGGPDATVPDAMTPDACVGDACVPTRARPLIDQVEVSRAVWSSLALDGGDTYWYEEENCGGPRIDGGGEVQAIQVERGVARSVGTRAIPQAECTSGIGRYGYLDALTMPMLYDLCRSVILAVDAEDGRATVRTDDRGVIQECSSPPSWSAGHSGCADFCGEGFVLQRWSFGTPGADQDGGTR
jgi:hypothetical protein